MTKWHLAPGFGIVFSISPKSLFSVPRGRPSRAENGEIRRVMAVRGDMKKYGKTWGKVPFGIWMKAPAGIFMTQSPCESTLVPVRCAYVLVQGPRES